MLPPEPASTAETGANLPEYERLATLLLEPLVGSPETLKIDCEVYAGGRRVWLRAAVDPADRGRVFGRGARNLDAIRTVLRAAGLAVDRAVHLEIYDSNPTSPEREQRGGGRRQQQRSRRNPRENGSAR